MDSVHLRDELLAFGNYEKARVLQGFFKTKVGFYGEGDVFAGIPVPVIRSVARRYGDIAPQEVLPLLSDVVHECRMLALLIWVEMFRMGDEARRKVIYDLYLANTDRINNWDLVDLSAYQVVGEFLRDKDRAPLYRLAERGGLWEQRISIVATWKYIREGKFGDTLLLADMLLCHSYDLIRKAVGWMLREVGKRDKGVLLDFLDSRCEMMPGTMLRYAIEKFSLEERAVFMRRGNK